jgi:hypothetical protein
MASHTLNNGFIKQIGERTNSLDNLSRFVIRSQNKKGDPSKSKDVSYSVESMRQSLLSLISNNPIIEFHLMPNFNFGYYYPPTGWVAKLDRQLNFSHDLLMSEEFFRCITIVEINKAIENTDFFKEICYFCIPTKTNTENYIGFRDNPGSGWTPIFAPRGNALGYFTFKDHDDDANEGVERHFLICDNSLPDHTLNLIQNYLIQEGISNLRLLNSNISDGTTQPKTVEEIISDSSYLGTFRDCAYEQNRRLLTILLAALEPSGIFPVKTALEKHLNRIPPHEDSYPTDEHYRHAKSNMKISDPRQAHQQLIDTLDRWPKGAPLYPFNVDPISGFPVGTYLDELYKVIDDQSESAFEVQSTLSSIQKTYPWFRFIREPLTFLPLIETMYNTFERQIDGSIIWRNNNADCQNPKGVIKKAPLSHGYIVINPSFCISHSSKPWEIREHLNSHPVIDPFEPDENKTVSEELLKKFFARENPPNQLKGSFLRDNELDNDTNIRAVLYPIDLIKIQMEPKLVYLSSGWQAKPCFEA